MSWYDPRDWFDDPAPRSNSQQAYTPNEYAPGTAHMSGSYNMGGLIGQGVLEGFNKGDRVAPQTGMDSQFRTGQLQQQQQLQGIASGQQQGAGELATQRQVQNALAGQQAMARMGHGANASLSSRNAARNSAGIGLSGAGMSQQAAMHDQIGAQGMLSNVNNQGRGQDSQIQLANLDAQLRQTGMNDAQRQAYMNQMITIQFQAADRAAKANDRDQQTQAEAYSQGAQIVAAGIGSDERIKTDVEDGDEDIDEMLDKLVAKNYSYKDEKKYGKGPRAGIMAQDMESSRAGKRVVRDVDGVKHLDVNAAISASLASVARLNTRLRKLEKTKAA